LSFKPLFWHNLDRYEGLFGTA